MRHLAVGGGTFSLLDELAGPMSDILNHFLSQQKQLKRYKKKYGKLPSISSGSEDDGIDEDEDEDEDQDDSTVDGSETE